MVAKTKYRLGTGDSSAKVLKEYLEFFLPILIQENSQEIMAAWFKDNDSALLRWGRWFQLSLKLWQELQEHRFILAKWSASFLLGQANDIFWDEELIVDLGPDLSIVEAQLLQSLSQNNNVKILSPNANWRENYSRALWPYQYLLSETTDSDVSVIQDFPHNVDCKRYVTQLSEVRACVTQVREWLDMGGKKSEISIVVADPEEYWPVLNAYLDKEVLVLPRPACVWLIAYLQLQDGYLS